LLLRHENIADFAFCDIIYDGSLFPINYSNRFFLSIISAPSSPSQQRKLLYANRGIRTGSVDLPDDVEKSLSSASTSPCPSPVRINQVPAFSHTKFILNRPFAHQKIFRFSIFLGKLIKKYRASKSAIYG
jgi:hypothetical protein